MTMAAAVPSHSNTAEVLESLGKWSRQHSCCCCESTAPDELDDRLEQRKDCSSGRRSSGFLLLSIIRAWSPVCCLVLVDDGAQQQVQHLNNRAANLWVLMHDGDVGGGRCAVDKCNLESCHTGCKQ